MIVRNPMDEGGREVVVGRATGLFQRALSEKMPPVNTDLLDGELAWRQHDGGHTDLPNIPHFIRWMNQNFSSADQ